MTEDQLAQEVLGGLAETGYRVGAGYAVAPDAAPPGVRATAKCCCRISCGGPLPGSTPRYRWWPVKMGLRP